MEQRRAGGAMSNAFPSEPLPESLSSLPPSSLSFPASADEKWRTIARRCFTMPADRRRRSLIRPRLNLGEKMNSILGKWRSSGLFMPYTLYALGNPFRDLSLSLLLCYYLANCILTVVHSPTVRLAIRPVVPLVV